MKTESNNIIFLYAEFTPYLKGCLDYFVHSNKSYNITVICFNIFKSFNKSSHINYNLVLKDNFKNKYELKKYCESINPSLIIMSGTMSKDYIYTSKKLSKECNIVSVQDTMISNSIKQFIQVWLYKFYFRTFIKFFWGVGTSQTRFGLKMGFKQEQIKEGFYVASRKFFENIVNPDYDLKNQSFLFIGRLVKEKNIMMLASVIDKINSETGSSHILKVIGDGKLKKQLLKYKCVRCYGILSQDEIIKVAKKSHLFCLPSIYEPWGVVVHEMTALGLPVVASYECGSAIDLVINEYNGYKFNSKDYNSLMQVIKNYLSLSSKEKSDFSKNSIKISRKIDHENWNNTLISLLKN